jgi:uncharacterized protein
MPREAHPERPLLAVAAKDLDHGPKHVRAELPPAWLTKLLIGQEEEGAEPISASAAGEVDVVLTPSGGDNYLLQGHVRATLDAVCGRCLGPARLPVDAALTLLLVPRHDESKRPPKGKKTKDSEGEFEFDPDQADIATYEGETVVLDALVREAVLLELPISPLCSEDCPGMRTDPAAREALEKVQGPKGDLRLAKLADFLPKK